MHRAGGRGSPGARDTVTTPAPANDGLESGQLGTADVTASTVANTGPGIDFYFGFGVIAVTASAAAPLPISAAAAAVLLRALGVAEFTRAEPSAGSFIEFVESGLGPFAVMTWVAGNVSVLATLVSGSNSQSRMVYDGGRTGKLPRWLGIVREPTHTPVRALVAIVLGRPVGQRRLGRRPRRRRGHGIDGPRRPYAARSTLGTIVIRFVYLLTMVSLPVYAWHRHRDRFSVVRPVVLPLLGAAALVVPFVSLCTPGQPSPYHVFPYAALVVAAVVGSFDAAWVVARRRH